jgi:hypothetical protein
MVDTVTSLFGLFVVSVPSSRSIQRADPMVQVDDVLETLRRRLGEDDQVDHLAHNILRGSIDMRLSFFAC